MTVGIDVFEGNKTPSWLEAIDDGHCAFALLRATEGTTMDKMYATYRAQCSALSLASSPYMFMLFGASAPTPTAQGHAFLKAIGPLSKKELVPAVDLEFPGGRAKYGISAQQALDALREVLAVIESEFGVPAMIYTSQVIWADPDGMNGLPAPDLAKNPLWDKYWPFPVGSPAVYDPPTVAALRSPPTPSPFAGQWTVQQYQGDAINYPGFNTKVDMNRLHVLRQGDKGGSVAWVQKRVGADPDGDFGAKTAAAVKAFQTAHGLVADAIVGLATMSALMWTKPTS